MSDDEESFVVLSKTSMSSLQDEYFSEPDYYNSNRQLFHKLNKNVGNGTANNEGAMNPTTGEPIANNISTIENNAKGMREDCLKENTNAYIGTGMNAAEYAKSLKLWEKPTSSLENVDASLLLGKSDSTNIFYRNSPNSYGLISQTASTMLEAKTEDYLMELLLKKSSNIMKSEGLEKQKQEKSDKQNNIIGDGKANGQTVPDSFSEPNDVNQHSNIKNDLSIGFIKGEVDAEVLKKSVCAQFPSISMNASPDEMIKLQSLIIDHVQLQAAFSKFTNTVRLYHENTLIWKANLKNADMQYKKKLQECDEQMKMLFNENERLKQSIDEQKKQTKALQIAQRQDRLELMQIISEKSAAVESMSAQIKKLEHVQLVSFDMMPDIYAKKKDVFEKYITREEHLKVIEPMQREIKNLLAQNLDLKNEEEKIMDDLNVLKTSLKTAEQALKQAHFDIDQLKATDLKQQQQLNEMKEEKESLINQIEKNREHIVLLEERNNKNLQSFESQKKSSESLNIEKNTILKELRILQKRNKQLIDDHEKWIDKQLSLHNRNNGQSQTANGVQEKIAPTGAKYYCPICNKSYVELSDLQLHVESCLNEMM